MDRLEGGLQIGISVVQPLLSLVATYPYPSSQVPIANLFFFSLIISFVIQIKKHKIKIEKIKRTAMLPVIIILINMNLLIVFPYHGYYKMQTVEKC